MKILGIDTSSEVAGVAIMDDEKLVAEYILNHKKTHSKNLMPMIESVLGFCEMKVDDIDIIAVVNGPGSFTGLRIGVASAKAMAHVKGIPIVSVGTLEALAFNMSMARGYIVPILDAQKGRVYRAVYSWADGELKRHRKVQVQDMDEFEQEIADMDDVAIVLGEASNIYRERLLKADNVEFPPSSHRLSRASSACEIARLKYERGQVEDHFTLSPVYIRKSQAEVQYEEKMKREKGNDGQN